MTIARLGMACSIVALLVCVCLSILGAGHPAHAQPAADPKELAREEKLRAEAKEALATLTSLLAARLAQSTAIEDLKRELKQVKEPALKKEVEEKIKAETTKLSQIDAQAAALTSGVATDEMLNDENQKFELQTELESLVQPFVRMMKDATENARQIESLKRTLVTAEKKEKLADRAIARLTLLIRVEGEQAPANGKKPKAMPAQAQLVKLLKDWQARKQQAEDLRETVEQQLSVRQDEQARSSGGLGTYATEFFRNRGLNLLLAISAFGAVVVIMGIVARIAGWVQKRQGIPRSFATRLASLLFTVATTIAAFLAMLAVFNIMNDWLLLGIASIFALATAWIGLKMLPGIAEQITLLLNLGAVQEGERLMFAGVPWRVKRLDFYTDLDNPALDGGTFTLPVRELVGLHSRPAARGEPWFPTRKGDWIHFDGDHVGRVLSQTPELVQVEEIGGSVVTFETSAFMALAPRNLSNGFRIRHEFGLDYRHQAAATDEIPEKLGAHVGDGLRKLLGKEGLTSLDVDLLSAGDSALVFEVEACVKGYHANRYEDVEREIPRLLVDACNKNGWVIPFPQMVIHTQSAGNS
jgi:hypothetical protein